MHTQINRDMRFRKRSFWSRVRLHYGVCWSYMPSRWAALVNAWRLARS